MGRSLVRDSLAVSIGSILRKASAFLREGALAYAFGAGPASDALLAAMGLPSLVVGLAGAAVGTIVVPLWRDVRRRRPEEALGPFNLTVLATAFLLLLLELGAGVIVPLLVPGFPARETALTVALTRLFLASSLGLVTAAFWKAVLEAEGRFATAALSALPVNLASGAGFLLAARHGVTWAAVAAVGAQFLELAWLFAFARRHLPAWRWDLRLSRAAAAHMPQLVPAVLAALVAQAGLVAARLFASGLPAGSLSSLVYAFQLASFLTGVTGGSFVTAAYPRLAEGGPSRAAEIERTFGWIVFVTLPLVPLLLLLAPDIVAAAFLRGHFTAGALSLTTAAFGGFVAGLPLSPLLGLCMGAAFARREGAVAALASAASVGVTVVGDLLLVAPLGVYGMAVAASAGQAAGLVVAMVTLWPGRALLRLRSGGGRLVPVALSALPCAALCGLWSYRRTGPVPDLGVAAAALATYLLLTHLARVPEAERIMGILRQRASLRARLGG